MFADSSTYPQWMIQRNKDLLDCLPTDDERDKAYRDRRRLQMDLQRADASGLDVTLIDLCE